MECSFRTFSQWQETNINDSPAKHIDEILDEWKDIHRNTLHGLALCFNVNKVIIIEVIEIPSVFWGIANYAGNRKGDFY